MSYSTSDFTPSFKKAMSQSGINPVFNLPLANEFLPSNTELKPKDPDNKDIPELIRTNDLMTVWYQQDKTLNTPKAITRAIVSSSSSDHHLQYLLYNSIYIRVWVSFHTYIITWLLDNFYIDNNKNCIILHDAVVRQFTATRSNNRKGGL